MTEYELAAMELELRRIRPARLPDGFAARLRAARPQPKIHPESATLAQPVLDFAGVLRLSLRWLFPATAVAVVLTVAVKVGLPPATHSSNPRSGLIAAVPSLKANDVKIDQRLVSSFDAVARLPGGEPVRFRCENWMDQMVLKDSATGWVVNNRQPRFEVVPVGFETY